MADKKQQTNWYIETDVDHIAWLCFDRAGSSTNTLSRAVMNELNDKIAELEALKPKAVIIYSAKKNGFIAGADIKEFTTLKTPDDAFDMIRNGQKVL
ncbi:MAG TPA: crotonase, partial [Gammaproteobacteria bacterium]|nr:crotonase [Gammaproteobacteria bacterium]